MAGVEAFVQPLCFFLENEAISISVYTPKPSTIPTKPQLGEWFQAVDVKMEAEGEQDAVEPRVQFLLDCLDSDMQDPYPPLPSKLRVQKVAPVGNYDLGSP